MNYKKPGRWDFLPFVLVRVTKQFVSSIPGFINQKKEEKRLEAERLQREEEERKEAAEKGLFFTKIVFCVFFLIRHTPKECAKTF